MRISLEQGNPKWLEWRKQGLGGSDAATLLGLNPFKKEYQLWAEKTGRIDDEPMNAHMERGVRCEPIARRKYIHDIGIGMAPCCYVHDEFSFMRASLDGIDMRGTTLLEIKCPTLRSYQKISESGSIPDYHMPQLQWNMLVSGATSAHYYVYSEEWGTGVLLIAEPDSPMQQRLVEAAKSFWYLVTTDTAPETGVEEYIHVECPQDIETEYLSLLEQERHIRERKNALRAAILECGDGGNFRTNNLRVTMTTPSRVDWKAYAASMDPSLSRADEFCTCDQIVWTIREDSH